jgi:hypothetical protein
MASWELDLRAITRDLDVEGPRVAEPRSECAQVTLDREACLGAQHAQQRCVTATPERLAQAFQRFGRGARRARQRLSGIHTETFVFEGELHVVTVAERNRGGRFHTYARPGERARVGREFGALLTHATRRTLASEIPLCRAREQRVHPLGVAARERFGVHPSGVARVWQAWPRAPGKRGRQGHEPDGPGSRALHPRAELANGRALGYLLRRMAAETWATTGLETGHRAPRVRLPLPAAVVGSVACLVSLGCGSPQARTPHPARPLEERRAIAVILQAFEDERDVAVRGRPVMLPLGITLEVDVAAQSQKYGVAYVTTAEQQKLGRALTPRDSRAGDALRLVIGTGEAGQSHVLLLYDTDYLYDDQVSDGQRETTVTAELKLRRDVRDFLVLARSRKWP